MFTTTNSFRVLVSNDQIPMAKIKDLAAQLTLIYNYLNDLSLGSTDEVILMRDVSAALTALASLDHREKL